MWNLLWHSLHRGDPLYLSHPPAHQKQPHLSTRQNTDSHLTTFSPENAKRRTHCLESKRVCCPPETWLLHPTGLWNWNLESMVRSLLAWLDSCKVLHHISAKELTAQSFLEGLHWLTAHFSYQGALSSWKNLISAVSTQWSRVTHLYTNVQILSFLPNDRPLTICTAFKLSFHFFKTMLNFNTFYIRCGSQAFSYRAILFEYTLLTNISLNLALPEWFPGLQTWFG